MNKRGAIGSKLPGKLDSNEEGCLAYKYTLRNQARRVNEEVSHMTKIAIHGFYGHGNLGDEAILHAFLMEARRIGGIEPLVFSANPRAVRKNHDVRSISAYSRLSFFKRLWKMRTCDLFLLGGGGLLKDFGPDSTGLSKWLDILRLALTLNVKTALFSIGVENIRFEKSKAILTDVLNKVDLITVRDNSSKMILHDIGLTKDVTVTADPAVLLGNPQKHVERCLDTSPRIVFCLRHWFSTGFFIENPEINEQLLDTISKTADYLIDQYSADISFIPLRTTSYDDDRLIAEEVVSRMKNKNKVQVIEKAPTVDEFVLLLQNCNLVVGMRLHSLILAAASGVPFIGLSYMPKVENFMNEMNLADLCLLPEQWTGNHLLNLVERVFGEYNHCQKAILSEIKRLQTISRNSISELVVLARQ